MEEQLSTQLEAAQPTPTSPVSVKQNNKLLIIIAVLVFLFMAGGLVYLGYQNYQLQQKLNKLLEQQSDQTQSGPTPTTGPGTSVLPSGWNYKSNNECSVKFAIPPKEAPYLVADGRFWDFPRGAAYPNLLSKVFLSNQEYKQAIAMFASPDEASGYIAQAVAVSCIRNNGRFADNNALISSLTTAIDEYNKSTGEKGMQASTYTIKTNTQTSRWSKQVVDLSVSEYFLNSGGEPYSNIVEYTMFVSPQYLYEVRVFGATTDGFVKDTANKIFDNLSF